MNPVIAKLSERFSETMIDDEVVVMSLDSGDFFSLTGTSREIWLLIDGTRSRDAIIAELAKAYEGEAEAINVDVDDFLCQLQETGFIVFH